VARTISRAHDVDRLIADLESSDPVRRDASVARLRVLGARALPRLATFIASPDTGRARGFALSALDGVDDPRVIDIALKALAADDTETVIAALGVLRSWVAQETGTRLLETITAIALDRSRDARIRVAAIDALADLPEHLVRPIREQAPPPEAGGPPLDNPVAALGWVEAHGANATLATLHEAIKKFRDSEGRTDTSRGREEWLKARALAHRMLADRGSRLALYDARETFSAAQAALPPEFLDAIGRVGDASCLEPLARAWSASRDARWRDQLSGAARQILVRSKLGSRNAVVKGIRANWAGFI
jgi:HEAT repeat protein